MSKKKPKPRKTTAPESKCIQIDDGISCKAPAEPDSLYCADHQIETTPGADGVERTAEQQAMHDDDGGDETEKAKRPKGKKGKGDSASKRADPFPRRMTRDLRAELTPDEKQTNVGRFVELLEQQKLLEDEKADSAASYKNRLGTIEEALRDLGRTIRLGSVMRTVDVEERRNDNEATIETVRLDTMQVIESRKQMGDERQLPLAK